MLGIDSFNRIYARCAVSGAMVDDDFRDGDFDRSEWSCWLRDPNFKIEERSGKQYHDKGLFMMGTSCAAPKMGNTRFAGVVSRRYTSRSAVLIAHLRPASGFSDQVGEEEYTVHLCGNTSVDCFAHVMLAKDFWYSREDERYLSEEGKARAWYFYWVDNRGQWHVDSESVPYVQEDSMLGVKIKIEYDHEAGKVRGFIWRHDSQSWIPVGSEQDLYLPQLIVELKMCTNISNLYRYLCFTDCRLYPAPGTAPVRFWVVRGRRFVPAIHVRLLTTDGQTIIGETDSDGRGCAAVELEPRVFDAYPAECIVAAYVDGHLVGWTHLPRFFPGDTWELVMDKAGDRYG